MKVITPEISWHGRDPLYSCDIHLNEKSFIRLATAGCDQAIRLWNISSATVQFLATLSRHDKAVNVVRFAPNSDLLASAGDDSIIIIWAKQDNAPDIGNTCFGDDDENKECWVVHRQLRSHRESVYDLSWSCDGKQLCSASHDDSGIVWDINLKQPKVLELIGHKSFLQGISFDPKSSFVATMCSDRNLRVFSLKTKSCIAKVSKLSSINSSNEKLAGLLLFHDDTIKSFFRRLAFSPDGSLLVVPSGLLHEPDLINTTIVFSRSFLTRPIVHLPTGPPNFNSPSLAVRFCPALFKLRSIGEDSPISVFRLKYRMIFAVATEELVIVYDTQQIKPIAVIGNCHYHQLSDICWNNDGTTLVISSTDGYISIVKFLAGELGELYDNEEERSVQSDALAADNCQNEA